MSKAAYLRKGQGMSDGALRAYEDGLAPASKVCKGVPAAMVREFLEPEEWHHCGWYANEVDFYRCDEAAVLKPFVREWQKVTALQKAMKEAPHRNREDARRYQVLLHKWDSAYRRLRDRVMHALSRFGKRKRRHETTVDCKLAN